MTAKSFEPVVDANTRVLVLGTVPGEESLRRGQYYANPANQLWRIIYALFDARPAPAYEQKISFIREHGVGLWDVLREAERAGSLDSAIRGEVANDFRPLLEDYPNIRCLAFNGGKSAKLFRRHIKYQLPQNLQRIVLPSTSPTPGLYVKNYEEKLEDWAILLRYLNHNTEERKARD